MRSVLTLLVGLFPAAFREQFGADVAEQVQADYDRARSLGRLKALGFWLVTAADLVRSALGERWNPSWVSNGSRSTQHDSGRWMMNGWTKDIRQAIRSLKRSPGFAVVTVGTLGLAIGANAGIFSVVDTILLDPLPFADVDRLVYVGATGPGSDLPDEFGVSSEFLVQYREESQLLEDVAGYADGTSTLRTEERTERVRMAFPTTSLFSTLAVAPVLGRLPTPEDDGRVALISHELWTTWFGADPSVVGRTYYVGGTDRSIIGVMGPDFWFPEREVVVWVPQVVRAEDVTPGRFGMRLVARMAPDVTPEMLAAELTRLALGLPERFGGSPGYARFIRENHRAVVRPLDEQLLGDVSGPLWVMLGSVGIVLLIACANVANLFIVRAERRRRALAVRTALGAGRAQLIRSLMSEALVVALLAGALAVLLAWVGVPIFLSAAPTDPWVAEIGVTPATLLFTLGASVLCTLLCGLLPAVRASVADLAALRDGARGSTRRRHWARDGLVVAQTALAVTLLIGSALLVRSFWALRNVDAGYDTEDLFTFQFAPAQDHLTDAPSWAAFHLRFMDRLRALPGVERVGIVENVPLDEGLDSGRYLTQETASIEDAALLRFTFSAGDYFGAMGIDVLRGRAFTRSDHVSELGNVIVSRATADLLWPGGNPMGRRIRNRDWGPEWETVVGVVEDVMQSSFRDRAEPLIYYPLVRHDPNPYPLSSPGYVVKTTRAEEIAPEIRALVREVAPEAPMYRTYSMEFLASRSMAQLSFTMLTLGIASVLAVILGAVGLFGVLSYVVAERTQEIGVRMALGAEAARVRRMVVLQGARVVVAGVLIGTFVAIGATRVLATLLFGVEPVDVATFAGMSATMVLVGLLASYLPARRASSVDPIRSLRES